MKSLWHIFIIISVCYCACNKPSQIDYDPLSLKECLGVTLPNTVSGVKLQIIKRETENILWLIAKFNISEEDVGRLAKNLGMIKMDEVGVIIPELPLIGDLHAPENAWWNPPSVIEQLKLKERYQTPYTSRESQGYSITMIWINGTAYIKKTGSYLK